MAFERQSLCSIGVVLAALLPFIGGCTATGNTKGEDTIISLSDLSHPPTVRLNWPFLDVTCPPSNTVSSAWIEVSGVRQEQHNQVVLVGRYVLREMSREQSLDLSVMGFSETQIPSMIAVWRNQDGSDQPLQIIYKSH
jgi:hypothetical protein